MSKTIPLCGLTPGQEGKVTRLNLSGAVRRMMQDLGVVNSTVIKALQKSPSGDPVAYLIKGAVIALRSDTAADIMVDVEGDGHGAFK